MVSAIGVFALGAVPVNKLIHSLQKMVFGTIFAHLLDFTL